MKIRLYEYFRSSASYRVRIALNLKGLTYESIPIHLTRSGGEQFGASFRDKNPAALVPMLELGTWELSQSLAILEYLEECHHEMPLLPSSREARAYVRQLALAIACDIHPLNNLRVLKYLTEPLGLAVEQRNAWIAHWIGLGFASLEATVVQSPLRGRFCCGDRPTIADCCLVPQVFNARRFKVDLTPFPTLLEIDAACQELEAIQRAHPSCQPDAE